MTDYPMTVNAQGVEIVDTSDGAWAKYVAEGREQLARSEAKQAAARHQLEMVKAEGLNAINTVQFDPEILAAARVLHNKDPAGPSVEEIIEIVLIPIREAYIASFEAKAPVTVHRVGLNESAFLKLLGETDE